MKRRILSFILLFVFFAQSMSAAFADTKTENRYENSIKALIALGIYDCEPDNIKPELNMSRKEVALWIYRALCLTLEYTASIYEDVTEQNDCFHAIMALSELGIVSGYDGGRFEPEKTIKYSEFSKVLINMLGYRTVAQHKGGYPAGYIQVASELKINKNVAADIDKPLTIGQAGQMLYNAMEVDLPQISIKNDSIKLGNPSGENLLSQLHGIYTVKGRVTANSFTSLTNPDGYNDHTVKIDGVEYDIGYEKINDFLGMYVTALCKEQNGTETVVYAYADENKQSILTLNAEDVIAEESTRTELRYHDDKRDSFRKIKISDVADIIYNGKAYPDLDNLYPSCGEIKLLDSDRDAVYDVLFITDYQTVVVEAYSPATKIIQSKYALKDSSKLIRIDDDDYVEIIGAEEDTVLEDISAGNVLMVAESQTGKEKIIKIEICDTQLSAVLNVISDDEYLCGEKTYKLSAAYLGLLASGEIDAPRASREYTFLLDSYGRIVSYIEALTWRQYGYFTKYGIKGALDQQVFVRILCQDAEWRTFPVRDKVKVNGDKMEAVRMVDTVSPNQLVRFETGKNGMITAIETAVYTDPGEPDYNELVENDTFRYCTRNKSTGNNIYLSNSVSIFNNFYLDHTAGVYVFEIPTTPADESVYDVVKGTSAFISELGYDVNVYDADEFRYSKIIVKNIDNDTDGDALKFRENDGFFVVKKAVRGIANGEVVSVVHGVQGGLDWSYTSTEKDTFDSLKKGDVIRTSYDSRGRLKSYKLIHSFGKEDVYSNLSSGALNGQNTYVFGLVKKVDSVKGRLLVDDGTEKAIRTSSSPKVTLFDTSTGEIKQASLSDIKPDDYICLRLYFSQVRDIVVYSN